MFTKRVGYFCELRFGKQAAGKTAPPTPSFDHVTTLYWSDLLAAPRFFAWPALPLPEGFVINSYGSTSKAFAKVSSVSKVALRRPASTLLI